MIPEAIGEYIKDKDIFDNITLTKLNDFELIKVGYVYYIGIEGITNPDSIKTYYSTPEPFTKLLSLSSPNFFSDLDLAIEQLIKQHDETY